MNKWYPVNRGGVKLTQSQIINSDGYALDAKENNPDIEGSLRNEINKKVDKNNNVYSATYTSLGLKDEEEVELNLELPISGRFLVEAHIGACGAIDTTKDSPYFILLLYRNDQLMYVNGRAGTAINISKAWDYNNLLSFYYYCQSGNIKAIFRSYMGSQLNSTYGSTFTINFIPI